MRSRVALLLALVCILLLPSIAFAQTAAPVIPTGQISATTIVIASLGIAVGYLSQAINSGSLFGVVTIPKPVLPYLGLAGGFLGAFTASITAAPRKDAAAWWTAIFAGLVGLGGVVAGVTAKQHLDAHLRDRTPAGGGSGGGNRQLADALRRAVNDAKAPQAAAPADDTLPPSTAGQVVLPRRIHGGSGDGVGLLPFVPRWSPYWTAAAILSAPAFAVFMLLVASCANGVPTPQTQAEIQAAEALGACVEATYVADAGQKPPLAALDIALDIARICGAEAIDVVGAFTPTGAPAAALASALPSRAEVSAAAQANAPALHVAAAAFHRVQGR